MDISAVYGSLLKALGSGKVVRDEPMSHHTSFRVGGPADIFISPQSAEEVAAAVSLCREAGLPLLVMGNGSNLLVRDGGIRGAVLQINGQYAKIEANGEKITAQAGALLSSVSAEACRLGLSGLEFASGIPGTIGGAAAMNAGAYGGEMQDVVLGVTALTPYSEFVRYKAEEMQYGYRRSRVLDERLIVLEVDLGLKPGDPSEIRAKMDEFTRRRRDKQPLELPSAGSFFKRPPGCFAGPLIEKAGLKGCAVGGAMVSEKHAGFIVNAGGATAADIVRLAEIVIQKVKEASGVELEMEVRLVGEDA